jgi:hypothetical protein
MNADQRRVVALALQYIRETKPDAYGDGPADSWTDADWDLWQRANPLQREMTEVSRQILRGEVEIGEYAHKLLDGDTPYSVMKGAWAIIEDAIYRRAFFASRPAKIWRAICG